MSQTVIEYPPANDGTVPTYRLVVAPADVRIGMQRSIYQKQAEIEEKQKQRPADDIMVNSIYLLHLSIWPAMMAATVEHDGFDHWPITIDEYMALPERLVIPWENAVFQANPHWALKFPQTEAEIEEARKKVMPSTSG